MAGVVSTIPGAIDAILERLRAAAAVEGSVLEGVQIEDGQPLVAEPDVIAIAHSGFQGDSVVENTRSIEQLAREPDRETYSITCLASSWRGGTDAKLVRDRAYELVNAVAADIAADKTLGGAVAKARLATDRLFQEQTTKGAVATVLFTVTVIAWTRG